MEPRENPSINQLPIENKGEASQYIRNAFTEDPELLMMQRGVFNLSLFVEYTSDDGIVRTLGISPSINETEEAEISETSSDISDEILVIFVKEGQPATFFQSNFSTPVEIQNGVKILSEPELKDTIRRVNSLLKSTKKYLEIFSLYTTYFNRNRSGLDVPVDRLWITNPYKGYKGGNLHTLNMVNQMLSDEMPISFENYGYDRVPIIK